MSVIILIYILIPVHFSLRSQVFGMQVNVVRIGNIHDFDTVISTHVNPAFHGLGHSGWDGWVDGKNRTQVIRFCRKEGSFFDKCYQLMIY